MSEWGDVEVSLPKTHIGELVAMSMSLFLTQGGGDAPTTPSRTVTPSQVESPLAPEDSSTADVSLVATPTASGTGEGASLSGSGDMSPTLCDSEDHGVAVSAAVAAKQERLRELLRVVAVSEPAVRYTQVRRACF